MTSDGGHFHYLRNTGNCWISVQHKGSLTLLFLFLLGAMKLEATKFRPREVVRHVLQTAAASMKKELTLEGHVADDVPVEVGVYLAHTFYIHGFISILRYSSRGNTLRITTSTCSTETSDLVKLQKNGGYIHNHGLRKMVQIFLMRKQIW